MKCRFFSDHEHVENCEICRECPCATNGVYKDREDKTAFWRNAELSQGTRIEEINKRVCKYMHYINGESICSNPKYDVCFNICYGYSPEIDILETSCRQCGVFVEHYAIGEYIKKHKYRD